MPGIQEIALIVGGVLVFLAVLWVVNWVNRHRGSASQTSNK